ncbi:MAG: tetratricopeptide repeat protein [Acetobacteraceae bacterium]
MSWSGGNDSVWPQPGLAGAIQHGALAQAASVTVTFAAGPPHSTPQPPTALEDLRRLARDAYAVGEVQEAHDLQQQVIAAARAARAQTADDHLFLGLMLYGMGRLEEGVATLREGLGFDPANPAMHENLGVFLLALNDLPGSIAACQQALAHGSDSPNVHDCLADAFNRLGRVDLAVQSGRAAMEAKDRKFGSRPPLVAIPAGLPPAFNVLNPAENVIAYCLWGNEPRYQVPLLENVRLQPHLFPGWTIRVYHDATVDPSYLDTLSRGGAQLRAMALPPNQPVHRKLLWRFDVISDPTVKRFLCRDADSLLSVKERVAVDAWLQSYCYFHAMRDWYSHTDLLLAGMWGGVGNVLPDLPTLLGAYTAWRVENDHVDQDVLAETVWPTIRHSVLIHDSIFAPCLGSVPFPPYGQLQPGFHIGQNAFMHFAPAS